MALLKLSCVILAALASAEHCVEEASLLQGVSQAKLQEKVQELHEQIPDLNKILEKAKSAVNAGIGQITTQMTSALDELNETINANAAKLNNSVQKFEASMAANFTVEHNVTHFKVREQLVAIHQHPRCSFSVSWKAFNQQHQGQSHLALSRCESLLGVFLVVGSAAVCLVHRELEATSPKSRRFHLVVLAKFILQDVPQQICFVLYLFGWYEAGGLRCQLCLFDAEHCSDEDAFHFSNVVVVGLILVSSLANQLLIRPVRKRRYTEDDVCMHMWIRVGGTCVATLPFTTGLCLSSRSLISQPTLTHVLFAAPCLLGWLSITGLLDRFKPFAGG